MAILAGLLLTTLLISGCQIILVTRNGDTGTGETETRQFNFTEFTRVDIGSAFIYEIKQSDTYSISITANDIYAGGLCKGFVSSFKGSLVAIPSFPCRIHSSTYSKQKNTGLHDRNLPCS